MNLMKVLSIALFALSFLPSAGSTGTPSVPPPTGSHGLRNHKYQLFLRPRDASNRDGTPIVLYPQQPWKCMAWKFEEQQDGTRLVNYFTGKSFEVLQAADGHPLVQQPATSERVKEQSWKFVAVGANLYKIETADGKGVLTAMKSSETDDIRVVAQPWQGLESQEWELVALPAHFTA
jgi:hypothetical protein